jgi:secreted Zn-dependent insulinase-like peptidase
MVISNVHYLGEHFSEQIACQDTKHVECISGTKHVKCIQVHQDDASSNIKLELFSLIASQPAFNQLRTVEQLGYITSLSLRYMPEVLYYM